MGASAGPLHCQEKVVTPDTVALSAGAVNTGAPDTTGGVGVLVLAGLGVAVGVLVLLGLAVDVGVLVLDRVAVGVGVLVAVAVGVSTGTGVAVGDRVGNGLGVRVGAAVAALAVGVIGSTTAMLGSTAGASVGNTRRAGCVGVSVTVAATMTAGRVGVGESPTAPVRGQSTTPSRMATIAKMPAATRAPAFSDPAGRAGARGVPPDGEGIATVLTPAAGEAAGLLRLPADDDDAASPAGMTPLTACVKSRANSPAL